MPYGIRIPIGRTAARGAIGIAGTRQGPRRGGQISGKVLRFVYVSSQTDLRARRPIGRPSTSLDSRTVPIHEARAKPQARDGGCTYVPGASSKSTPVACSSCCNMATGRGAAAAGLASAHQALRPLVQASLALVEGQAGRPRRSGGRPLRYRHPRARRPERPHGGAVRCEHTAAGAGTTSLRVKLEAEGCWAPAPT